MLPKQRGLAAGSPTDKVKRTLVRLKHSKTKIYTEQVDADKLDELVALFNKHKPQIAMHLALPYQNLTIMEACLRAKVHYLDTANYEHPDNPHFQYEKQWSYHDRFKEAGIMALLGGGFDRALPAFSRRMPKSTILTKSTK